MGKRSFKVPLKIRNIIEDNNKETRLQKDRMYKVLYLITQSFIKRKENFDEFIEIPSSYWKKSIASHYEIQLNFLVAHGIVERDDFYSYGVFSKCKEMRINPEMMKGDKVRVDFKYGKKDQKKLDEVTKRTKRVLRKLKMDRVAVLKFLKGYLEGGTIENKLEFNESIKDLGEVLRIRYKAEGRKKSCEVFNKKEEGILFAKLRKRDLIYDDGKYRIANRAAYIENKKKNVEYSYLNQIDKFLNREYYADRNDTNRRVDTNLTTLPSVLMPYLKLDGERLVGFDLSNSQFLFLSYLIENGMFDKYIIEAKKFFDEENKTMMKKNASKYRSSNSSLLSNNKLIVNGGYLDNSTGCVVNGINNIGVEGVYMCAKEGLEVVSRNSERSLITGDIALFIEFAKNGKFYEYVRDELGLGEGGVGRKRAKQMMFEVFFSKHDNTRSTKKEIEKLFPMLVKMIDLFKKEKREERKLKLEEDGKKLDNKGDNQFAIELQKAESEIFIDRILVKLLKEGFDVLSKHDSILCKESEEEEVEAIIKGELDDVFGAGNYNLTVERY